MTQTTHPLVLPPPYTEALAAGLKKTIEGSKQTAFLGKVRNPLLEGHIPSSQAKIHHLESRVPKEKARKNTTVLKEKDHQLKQDRQSIGNPLVQCLKWSPLFLNLSRFQPSVHHSLGSKQKSACCHKHVHYLQLCSCAQSELYIQHWKKSCTKHDVHPTVLRHTRLRCHLFGQVNPLFGRYPSPVGCLSLARQRVSLIPSNFLASRDLHWITSSECFQQHIVCFMPFQLLKYVTNMWHGFCWVSKSSSPC